MDRGEVLFTSLDRFAHELVGLDNDLEPGERMKSLYRKLQDQDFLPDPLSHEAILTLSGRTLDPNSPLLHETKRRRERNLVEAVEEFAGEFFSIPVADRVNRWNQLAEACKGKDWLIHRLLDLRQGLRIDPQAFGDTSPAVHRLIEDLLELFPLRPSSHGIESRVRATRFRNDPSLTPAQRARVLKQVLRQYRTIALLSRGYLETLGERPGPGNTRSFAVRLVRAINAKFEAQPQWLVLLIGCLMATLILLGWIARPDPRTRRPPVSQQQATSTPTRTQIPSSSSGQPDRISPTVVIREEFAAKIRQELKQIGKQLDKEQLETVLDGLPIESLPKVGGLSTIVLRGLWTKQVQTRFVSRLKTCLKETDLELTEAELDAIAPRCFPRPTDETTPRANRRSMSDHELPGDSSTWPTDPFRLLGVVPGSSPRDLRKAYLKLIRSFKPEHHPEEFQKIRQAYEAALELTNHFGTFHEDVTEPNRFDVAIETPRTFETRSNVRSDPEPTIDPWELACQGDTETAYRLLIRRAEEQGHPTEETYLQLYWLQTLVPGIDASRLGIDWLLEGLLACGSRAGRLRELFRRELGSDMAIALSDRIVRFFQRKPAPALVHDAILPRWKAARITNRWALIRADVQTLRAWLPGADQDAWARLLIAACMQLGWAWKPESDPVDDYCREVHGLANRGTDYSDELYQVEFVQILRAGIDRLGVSGEAHTFYYGLLSCSWDDQGPEERSRLRSYVDQIARDPQLALEAIDHVQETAPAILGRLTTLMGGLDSVEFSRVVPRVQEELVLVVARFLAEHRWNDYRAFRLPLLRFCLQEAISPGLVARTLADRPEFVLTGKSPLAHWIVEDWPLRHVYRATELSWEDPTTFPFGD